MCGTAAKNSLRLHALDPETRDAEVYLARPLLLCLLSTLAAMAAKLQLLPAEVLQDIAIHLPSASALAFTLTCRSMAAACDDWLFWRNLVASRQTLAHSHHAISSSRPASSAWKRCVVADALACQPRLLDEPDMEGWVPFMVAMRRMLPALVDCKQGGHLLTRHTSQTLSSSTQTTPFSVSFAMPSATLRF